MRLRSSPSGPSKTGRATENDPSPIGTATPASVSTAIGCMPSGCVIGRLQRRLERRIGLARLSADEVSGSRLAPGAHGHLGRDRLVMEVEVKRIPPRARVRAGKAAKRARRARPRAGRRRPGARGAADAPCRHRGGARRRAGPRSSCPEASRRCATSRPCRRSATGIARNSVCAGAAGRARRAPPPPGRRGPARGRRTGRPYAPISASVSGRAIPSSSCSGLFGRKTSRRSTMMP